MGYGICRVEKVKASSVGAMQYHNDRMPGEHANPDIDQLRSGDNVEFVPHGGYRREVDSRIEEGRESTRKVRKDAVVLVEGIVTASPEFFDGMSRDKVTAYFHDAFEFVRDEAGERNVIHFTVHLDETTPHAHFGFTPIKDGQLSWKKFFDGRAALSAFQDRFYDRVAKGHGLERGERDTGRTHKDMTRMRRAAERDLSDTRGELGEISDLIDEKRSQAAEFDMKIAEKNDRLECLRLDERRISGEIEEIQPAAETVGESFRALIENRGGGGREQRLASERIEIESGIAELEREIEGAREREVELERGNIELGERKGVLERTLHDARGRAGGLERRVAAAREAFERLADRFRDLIGYAANVGRDATGLLESLGVTAFEGSAPPSTRARDAIRSSRRGRSMREEGEMARRASRAMSESTAIDADRSAHRQRGGCDR